jgi:predicted secreted hydrolase
MALLTIAAAAEAAEPPRPATLSPAAAYRQAAPGYRYEFPQDHGSHDEFRTEWWYYTGHLSTPEGRRFGFELTFFRRALAPPGAPPSPSAWRLDQLYLAHAAVTDLDGKRFLYDEKISRAGLGKAGADRDRLHVWIDRWRAEAPPHSDAPQRLQANAASFSLDLRLTPHRGPVIHGRDGLSRKGDQPHETSHYYSFTRLSTEGRLTLDGADYRVTGLSWMDHEFGSGDLGDDLVGWDWFSLQLDNRSELMLYRLRRSDGRPGPASSGTLVQADGRVTFLRSEEIQLAVLGYWTSPASKARYPQGWEVKIPTADMTLILQPLLDDQELITARSTQVTYWEGAVTVTGQAQGKPVTGQGYAELTGYARSTQSTR